MNIPLQFIIDDDDHALLGQFTVWMKQVVIHAAIDYSRRQAYRKQEPFGLILPDDFHSEGITVTNEHDFDFAGDKLAEAFSDLTLLRRRILTYIFVEGLSAQETADKLGCSVDYVYLQKHRALKKLRNQLIEGGGRRGN